MMGRRLEIYGTSEKIEKLRTTSTYVDLLGPPRRRVPSTFVLLRGEAPRAYFSSLSQFFVVAIIYVEVALLYHCSRHLPHFNGNYQALCRSFHSVDQALKKEGSLEAWTL